MYIITPLPPLSIFFFFNDPAPTEISPLSLHAALPIFRPRARRSPDLTQRPRPGRLLTSVGRIAPLTDQKSLGGRGRGLEPFGPAEAGAAPGLLEAAQRPGEPALAPVRGPQEDRGVRNRRDGQLEPTEVHARRRGQPFL